jgi:hypothetical protein
LIKRIVGESKQEKQWHSQQQHKLLAGRDLFNFGQLVNVSIMNSSLAGIAHVYL